jgi:hypothetical protein
MLRSAALLCFLAIITMILFQLRKQIELDFMRLAAVAFTYYYVRTSNTFISSQPGYSIEWTGWNPKAHNSQRVFTLNEIHTQET